MRAGWKTMKLDDACFVDYGTRVVRKKDGGTIYPVYGGGGATFRMDTYNREDCLVVARFAMSQTCTRFVQGKFFLNDSGLTLRARDKDLSQIFLDWIITSKNDLIYSFGKGSAQKNLDMEDFRNMEISFPISLAEQQRIVDILDQEFAKIDALKANAEKSLQAAKDLFQATLKKELEPKEGWKTMTIGDVCYVQGGSTPRRTEKAFWENGTYPWFTVDDIREQGRIITYTKQKITKLAWEKMRVFPANSVLLCCTASVGEYALSTIPITSNQQFNGLTIKDERTILPMFLFHFASTLKDTLLSLSGKTTIDFVSGGKVRSVPISFPASVKEQESIISRLNDLNEKCDTLQDNYQKTLSLCDDMKQALLHKAFSGEL